MAATDPVEYEYLPPDASPGSSDGEYDYWLPENESAGSPKSSVASTTGPLARGLQLGVRGVVKGAAGLADMAVAVGGGTVLNRSPDDLRRVSAAVDPWLDKLYPPPQSNVGRMVEAGAAGAATGPQAALPSFAGGVASEFARQQGAPWWAQLLAGVGAGWATSAARGAFTRRPQYEQDIDLLLRNRDATRATTDADVQAALKKDYNAAKAPFIGPYRKLHETKIDVPIKEEILDIPASRPRETMATPVMSRGNQALRATLDDPDIANVIKADPYLRRRAAEAAADKSQTVGELMARIDVMQDYANKAKLSGAANRARVLGAIANSMKDDLDTMVGTMGRELDAAYGFNVKGPYAGIRRTFGGDASLTWRQFMRLPAERKQAIADAVSPQTRELMRRRIVKVIIDREEGFAANQAGSGAPAWRALNNSGAGAFFNPDEWRGLQKLTGAQAAFRNPFKRGAMEVGAAGAGGVAGGPVGAATGWGLAKFLEFSMASEKGRMALAIIGRMPGRIRAQDWPRITKALTLAMAANADGEETPQDQ